MLKVGRRRERGLRNAEGRVLVIISYHGLVRNGDGPKAPAAVESAALKQNNS